MQAPRQQETLQEDGRTAQVPLLEASLPRLRAPCTQHHTASLPHRRRSATRESALPHTWGLNRLPSRSPPQTLLRLRRPAYAAHSHGLNGRFHHNHIEIQCDMERSRPRRRLRRPHSTHIGERETPAGGETRGESLPWRSPVHSPQAGPHPAASTPMEPPNPRCAHTRYTSVRIHLPLGGASPHKPVAAGRGAVLAAAPPTNKR